MFFTNALLALASLVILATAAPTNVIRDSGPAVGRRVLARGSSSQNNAKNSQNSNNRNSGSNTIIIQQTVVKPVVTVVQENLGLLNNLALVAEQEFSALVQSQLALVQQVETIKTNIRINHFLSRFPEVNTVIVCVTQLVDMRDSANGPNTRYMVNQLLADNGKTSSVVVMLTAASPVTISPVATPSVDLSGLLGGSNSAGVVAAVASGVPAVSASGVAAAVGASASASASGAGGAQNASDAFPQVAAFDKNNPFGTIGQSVILPYGSEAPSMPNGAQIVLDPARIILPKQNNLLVEDINSLSQDCSLFTAKKGGPPSLFNLQSAIMKIDIASEIAGLILGTSSALNAAAPGLMSGSDGQGGSVGSSGGANQAGKAAVVAAAATSPVTGAATGIPLPSIATQTAATSSVVAAPPVLVSATTAVAAPATPAPAPGVQAFGTIPGGPASAAPPAAPPATTPVTGTGSGVQLVPVSPVQ